MRRCNNGNMGTFGFLFRQISSDLFGANVDVISSMRRISPHRRHWLCRVGELMIPSRIEIDRNEWFEALAGKSSFRWSTCSARDLEDLVSPPDGADHFAGTSVTVSGVSFDDARKIALSLKQGSPRFVGAIEIDINNRWQCSSLWALLSPSFRVIGNEVRVLVPGENLVLDNDGKMLVDSYHPEFLKLIEELGTYSKIEVEDQGVNGSIFDPADSLWSESAHLAVEEAVTTFSSAAGSDLAHRLSVFAPAAAKELRAAVIRISTADSEEEGAQAAVSLRRFYEKLADALYPPRSELRPESRKLGQSNYKNRYWAYISENIVSDTSRQVAETALQDIGARVEALNDSQQKGVHADMSFEDLFRLCQSMIWFAWDLVALRPLPLCVDDTAALQSMLRFFRESDASES